MVPCPHWHQAHGAGVTGSSSVCTLHALVSLYITVSTIITTTMSCIAVACCVQCHLFQTVQSGQCSAQCDDQEQQSNTHSFSLLYVTQYRIVHSTHHHLTILLLYHWHHWLSHEAWHSPLNKLIWNRIIKLINTMTYNWAHALSQDRYKLHYDFWELRSRTYHMKINNLRQTK